MTLGSRPTVVSPPRRRALRAHPGAAPDLTAPLSAMMGDLAHLPAPVVRRIDLNADLGEGFGPWALADDDALLDLVTSANVACGFHAGDPVIMRDVTRAAVGRGVSIGAHVAYRDLAGFGRRFLAVAPADLTADVAYQLGALDAFARLEGDRVR